MKLGPPWTLSGSGLVVYSAEVEVGEHNAYRPRTEIARLMVDDPDIARLIVAAPELLAALQAAIGDVNLAACTAKARGDLKSAEALFSHERIYLAAITKATKGTP